VTREDYRDVHHCGEKICVAKTQLEFKLARTVKEKKKKKRFFKNMLTARGRSEINLVHYLMRLVTLKIWM